MNVNIEQKVKHFDLIMPKCVEQGLAYWDDTTNEYTLKPNAPKWARKDLAEYYRKARGVYDEKTGMTQRY